MKLNTRFVALTLVASAGLASSAMAAPQFTTVNAPPAGEKGHGYILGQIYGGSFGKTSNGLDYSNGTLTAARLADMGAPSPTSLSNPTSGLTGDNQWIGPATTTVTAKAKYAADNAIFGYFDDTKVNPTFTAIFNTMGFNQPAVLDLPDVFRWAIKDTSTGKTWTSRASDNMDGGKSNDQLVTYTMRGLAPGVNEWVLFWEDRSVKDCSDYDFNDSAITITTQSLVPTPGTATLFGVGCALMRRRRR